MFFLMKKYVGCFLRSYKRSINNGLFLNSYRYIDYPDFPFTPTVRMYSKLQDHSEIILKRGEEELHDFMTVFPDIVRELTTYANQYNSPQLNQRLIYAMEYNIPRGKKSRGILTVQMYKNMTENITPEKSRLVHILGWCVEMLQCVFLLCDDIMDNSTTRRGQLCWHKLENIGLTGLNDALIIESAIYYILKKHFSHLDCYSKLMEVFHEITLITTCGQALDLITANDKVSTFTMEKYKTLVTNKTSYYTFYLPFVLALHLANFNNTSEFQQYKNILLEMGLFFQIQNDFLDCFGQHTVTGKVGTDIQENKCTWLAVSCMEKANEQQRYIMQECYGKNDIEKINRVKELYKELDLQKIFASYEDDSYEIIKNKIQEISLMGIRETFLIILERIFQRPS